MRKTPNYIRHLAKKPICKHENIRNKIQVSNLLRIQLALKQTLQVQFLFVQTRVVKELDMMLYKENLFLYKSGLILLGR